MNVSRSNLQIRDDLLQIVEQVELRLSEKGFHIPRDEILGYLLEIVIKKNNMPYSDLISNYGRVEKIVNELAKTSDIIWPVDPWYGGKISLQNQRSSQTPDQTKSSNFMRTVLMSHYISVIASVYIAIRILLALALALLLGDPASFEIIIDLTPMNVGIFIWYPIFSIIAYSTTARISHKTELRAGVDDMETWLSKIKRTAYFHTITLFGFYGFYFLGSRAVVVSETSPQSATVREANGMPITITYILIIASFYLYQIGLKKLLFDTSGGEYWYVEPHQRRIVRNTMKFLIFFKQFIGIILIIAYIAVSSYFEDLKNYNINLLIGIDESYILVCFIYFVCNMVILLILAKAAKMDHVKYWFRSSIQTDLFNLFSFGLFSYMVIQMKMIVAENRMAALPGYEPSLFTEFLLLPLIVIISSIFIIQAQFLIYRYKFDKSASFLKLISKNGYSFQINQENDSIDKL